MKNGAVLVLSVYAFMARTGTSLPFTYIRTLLCRLKLNSRKYNRVLMFRILIFYDHCTVISLFVLWRVPLNWDEIVWVVSQLLSSHLICAGHTELSQALSFVKGTWLLCALRNEKSFNHFMFPKGVLY
jgi:hypothetical protein